MFDKLICRGFGFIFISMGVLCALMPLLSFFIPNSEISITTMAMAVGIGLFFAIIGIRIWRTPERNQKEIERLKQEGIQLHLPIIRIVQHENFENLKSIVLEYKDEETGIIKEIQGLTSDKYDESYLGKTVLAYFDKDDKNKYHIDYSNFY